MRCCYPNCRNKQKYVPVVEVPTYRIGQDGTVTATTQQPTYLLCREVCEDHKAKYVLADWVSLADWKAMQESAREVGFHIPEIRVVVVQFMPLGWQPKRGYLELERTTDTVH